MGTGTISYGEPASSVQGTEVTLFWGDEDGTTNPANWDYSVSLDKFYKEGFKVNGFHARGFQFAKESFLEDIESMFDLKPDQSIDLKGEPDMPLPTECFF